MSSQSLIEKVQGLTVAVEGMTKEKALALEAEQAHKSAVYCWVREQMMAIHQLKYQFAQEVAKLHQEALSLNQEQRQAIERLRGKGLALSPQSESLAVDNTQLVYSLNVNPVD